jgi:hypothetical protein
VRQGGGAKHGGASCQRRGQQFHAAVPDIHRYVVRRGSKAGGGAAYAGGLQCDGDGMQLTADAAEGTQGCLSAGAAPEMHLAAWR